MNLDETTETPPLRKRRWRTIVLAIVAIVMATSIGMNGWFIQHRRWSLEQNAERVQREHGVVLPSSASSFQCAGDAWKGYLDRGASSIFLMSVSDLSQFKSQLHPNSQRETFIPGNPVYRSLKPPWDENAKPLEVISCDSATGDWLHVEIWPVNKDVVGVWMYTDWN